MWMNSKKLQITNMLMIQEIWMNSSKPTKIINQRANACWTWSQKKLNYSCSKDTWDTWAICTGRSKTRHGGKTTENNGKLNNLINTIRNNKIQKLMNQEQLETPALSLPSMLLDNLFRIKTPSRVSTTITPIFLRLEMRTTKDSFFNWSNSGESIRINGKIKNGKRKNTPEARRRRSLKNRSACKASIRNTCLSSS